MDVLLWFQAGYNTPEPGRFFYQPQAIYLIEEVAKGYSPANAETRCRRGGGAGKLLNKKNPKPAFSRYFITQINL
jgi:hypothetical protein